MTPPDLSALAEGLDSTIRHLSNIARCDLDEIVADGGITAGMVVQQEIRTVILPRLNALRAHLTKEKNDADQ